MSTHVVNTHDAKSRLSELIRLAEAGDEVIVARNGTYVARIVPWEQIRPQRISGSLKEKIHFAEKDIRGEDPDILEMFEESIDKPLP